MENKYIAHYLGPNKAAQSVQKHLEEAAELARFFADKIGLPSLGELLGILHDFGKYSRAFQGYIRSAEGMVDPDAEPDAAPTDAKKLKGKIDHSTAGAQKAWQTLKDQNRLAKLAGQIIALCVASHHGGLIDCISPEGKDTFSNRMAKEDEKTHLNEVLISADREVLEKIKNLLCSNQCVEEFKIQLERLSSGEESKEVCWFYLGLLTRFLFSAVIDADRLSSAGRGVRMDGHVGDRFQWDPLIERLERHILGIEQKNWVDKLRTEISLACQEFASREKGLYRLTVPTGGAKTLSSLRFGLHHAAHHRMERLIYVIPYTSIIDQNADVARAILEANTDPNSDPIVLEHHSNLTPEKETWQSRLLAENWDAPVIFTTTVQFLESLFSGGTRSVRRMHNLGNAVIIFDEIQTLPIKTVHLFNNTINFLVKQCGSTVIFCTATQPLLHAVDPKKGAARLSPEPEMVPRSKDLFKELHRVEVLDRRKVGGWTEEEVAQCICDEAKETGSGLVIVNTKAAARTLFKLCQSQMKTVFHLSTSMCPVHRLEIINTIKERLTPKEHLVPTIHEPLVCISTQLIEAGVDVDFGSVMRYLAGLDSIAQAAGRCNRNGGRPLGKVLIVNPCHESLDKLPDIALGRDITERVLGEYQKDPTSFDCDLLSPKAMQRYYEYYFFKRTRDMAYRVHSKEIGHDDDLLSLLSVNTLSVAAYARSNNQSAPPVLLFQSFKSAGRVFKVIDAPTEGVIVPYKEGKEIIGDLCAVSDTERTRQLLRKAQRYSVNLYRHERDKLLIYETQNGSGIFYLDESHYSKDTGVVLEPKEHMSFLQG